MNVNNMEENNHNRPIYLDYQATTPLDERVLKAMLPYMTQKFGNPHSSEHSMGWEANEAVEQAKTNISDYINSLEDEIIFTSGATESNNLAIVGLGYAALEKSKRRTILVSSIEHKCVLGSSQFLEKLGFRVKKIPVKNDGLIDIDRFISFLNDDILLVSVMATNNEIGVNEPVKEIGKICKEHGILFHVDGSQGAYSNLDVVENNIDYLSISGHKIYGPKGIGCLYINQDALLKPMLLLHGGGQQNGYRSGTIPTFLAVGLGTAAQIMQNIKSTEINKLLNLRNQFYNGLVSMCPEIKINGNLKERHPGNLNITLPNLDSKQFIILLQPYISFSTGSACTSGTIEPSHVLMAIGLSTAEADRSFRLSVGRFTTSLDIEKALNLMNRQLNNSLL